MCLQYTINDLFDLKVNSDKLELLYKENESATVKVLTPYGDTEEFSLQNTQLQGTIFAGLSCTTQLDKLGRKAYHEGKPLFLYKNTVRIPPLEMVDDCAIATTCSNDAIKANSVVNTFIENQKLRLSQKKCKQIHIGKSRKLCPSLNVHQNKMNRTDEEKYLGNLINTTGNSKNNTKNRVAKGYGFSAEILSMIKEIPFGRFQIEVALKLRESMLINGMLVNSEVAYGLSLIHI